MSFKLFKGIFGIDLLFLIKKTKNIKELLKK